MEVKVKIERIEERKKVIGSKHRRKLKRYSDSFNRMITFFFLIQKRGVITFCGSHTIVEYDPDGPDCKECFRLYEDGYYRGGKPIITRHPNILKSVLIGKKGWGLWVDQWTEGIVDWTFTKEDILNEFKKVELEIPESFLIDFNNTINKKRLKRNLIYLEQISR